MGRLLLIRHVESQYDQGKQELSEGWRDIPPSVEGRKQAQEVAGKLKDVPIKEVISSDLQRNKILGRAIAAETGAHFETSTQLRPMNVGSLAGRPRTENKKTIEYYRQHPDKPFPGGGETFRVYVKRWLVSELPRLQEQADKLDGDLAAITHSHNIQDAYEYLNFKKLTDLPETGSVWEVEDGHMEPWEPDGESSEKTADRGIGTPVAGYVERGPTFCGSCKYQKPINREFGTCREKHVLLDPRKAVLQVLDDGNRKVDLIHGCCYFWDDGKGKSGEKI